MWGERVYSRLFYWNEAAGSGHFPAFEQPAVFVEQPRAAVRALPRAGLTHEMRMKADIGFNRDAIISVD